MYSWTQQSQQIFRAVLLFQWLLSLFIGGVTSHWLPAFMFGLPILAVPLWLSISQPASRVSRYSVAIGVQLMTALHIHQAFGMIELHFEIFVLLAFLAYYRDWVVILLATLVVAVHHILFFIIQAQGMPVFVFEEGHVTFSVLVIHALFALAAGGVLIFMTRRMHEEGVAAETLRGAIDQMLADKQRIRLDIDMDDSHPSLKPFHQFLVHIRTLLGSTSTLTQQVAQSTQHLLEQAQHVRQASLAVNKEVATVTSAAEDINGAIHGTVKHTQTTTEQTQNAQHITRQTVTDIVKSNESISSLRTTLMNAAETSKALSERCSSITDAMRAITAIAEQTNLLALNAAIESARAGQHGRGFAVVADEVRTLAIRSKESADQITKVTEDLVTRTAHSVTQMQTCVDLVDNAVSASAQATEAMRDIASQISQVSSNMSQITSATEEQEAASQLIARASATISRLVEQEVSSADSLNAQLQSLSSICAQMQQAVNRFHV